MGSQVLRFLLTLLLAVGLSGGMAEPASATPLEGPTKLYFPWIPFGSIIEDPRGFPDAGPFFGTVTIQNLENDTIDVSVYATATYEDLMPQVHVLQLAPHASTTIVPDQIFTAPGIDGTGLFIEGMRHSNSLPATISAVMRTMSPATGDPATETSNANITVAGHTAHSEYGVGYEHTLPVVQTNSNWNTLIRVTATEIGLQGEVSVVLLPSAGDIALGPFTKSVDAGQTATFDLLGLGVSEDWVGSAWITSDLPTVAIAERIKNETNMLIINASRTLMQSSTTQVASLVFRDWNYWNTGIAIQNLEALPNTVQIDFYGTDGSLEHSESLPIPAARMDFVYLPASPPGEEEPFVGSAVLTGEHPFHAVVDEVKYFGDDPDTGHAMSYNVDYVMATPGQSLALPLFQKGDPIGGGGDTSGIQLFSFEGQADVEIEFYDESGASIPEALIELTIGEHEGETAYSMTMVEIPEGFTGSAIVRNVSLGDGPVTQITAVSNLVNYDVQYDGSSSFNMHRFWFDPPL
jgi:hypothetical protein